MLRSSAMRRALALAQQVVDDDDDDDDELGARGYHRFETHERERDARHGTRDATGAE